MKLKTLFLPLRFRVSAGVVMMLLALGAKAAAAPREPMPPNLVFILVDDLGYGDLGCYGNALHRTPNLDRLAAEGARFTSYYVTSPVCTPTRYALMTGKHPARTDMFGVIWPPTEGGMAPDEITLAEWLGGLGYSTGLAGKWHLGHSDPELLPPSQGFDDWYGMPYPNDMDPHHSQREHVPGHWPPMPMYRQYGIVEAPIDVDLLTQQYTAEAVRFIAENHHRPFFLFLSHAMTHGHLGASPDFKGESANGLYGDAVEELDWSVGEIMRVLRAFGLDERTLVIFTSDNGASVGSGDVEPGETPRGVGSNGSLRSGKGRCFEGGVRVPGIFRWTGRIPAGRVIDAPAIITDTAATFAAMADLPPMDAALDSVSIAPVLRGERREQERFLFFGSGDARAVRHGKWKYHLTPQPPWQEEIVEDPMLFNLEADIGETNNVIEEQPAIARRLREALVEYRKETGG